MSYGRGQGLVTEPLAMALSPIPFVQREPQISQHGLSLALQPFHAPTHPDRRQHAEGDCPNSQFQAKNDVFHGEVLESIPLDRLAEVQYADDCRTDEEMGGYGCAVFRLIHQDDEHRADDRAVPHYR